MPKCMCDINSLCVACASQDILTGAFVFIHLFICVALHLFVESVCVSYQCEVLVFTMRLLSQGVCDRLSQCLLKTTDKMLMLMSDRN